MIFELIGYAIMGVIGAMIGYWGIHSEYFIFRVVGAFIVGVLCLYGTGFISVLINKFVMVSKKSKLIICGFVNGVILAPLVHWGLFNDDILFKVLGVCIIIIYISAFWLVSLFSDITKETKTDESELNSQQIPIIQPKQTAQPKPATKSKPTKQSSATQPKPVAQPKPVTKTKPTTQPTTPATQWKQITQSKQITNQATTVTCSQMIDLFVANLKDKDYCYDKIQGFKPNEAKVIRNTIDLNCLLATWLRDSLNSFRAIRVNNNDITLINVVKLQEDIISILSLLLKKNEGYDKIHIYLSNLRTEEDVNTLEKLYGIRMGIKDDELKIVCDVMQGLEEFDSLHSFIEVEKFNHDEVEKKEESCNEQDKKSTDEKFYSYVCSMSSDTLLSCINNEYLSIKGHYSLAPRMGEFGCFEFASALLLWNYAKENFMSNQRTIGDLQIMLADVIGCAFFGMPAGEWSDKIDVVINDHESILSYKEWSKVYTYLRNNFADSIHKIEFNDGNAPQEVYIGIYTDFTALYNSTERFSDVIDYYTSRGIHLGKDIKFRING